MGAAMGAALGAAMEAVITLNSKLQEQFDSLCIGLLQESAPKLTLLRRAEVDQSVVHSGQQIIDPHLQPLAVHPELHTQGKGGGRGLIRLRFSWMKDRIWVFTLKVKQPL